MKLLYFLGFCFFLAGCASVPTPEEIANADYGTYPSDYEKIVKDYFATALVDPYSAVWQRIDRPEKQMWGDRISGARFDYKVCVSLNAKNRMGGYVGYTPYAMMIHNGSVSQAIEGGQWFGRQLC